MAALSDYLEEKLLNHVFRQISYTGPGAIYVGLFKTNPGDDNSGEELYGNGYDRVTATFEAGTTNGTIVNDADIVFPQATATWPTVEYIGLFDNRIGGNLLVHTKLAKPIDIDIDDSFLISANNMTIALD
jgi:hypothetical protein